MIIIISNYHTRCKMKFQNYSLRFCKIIIAIMFVVSVIFIAIYPVKNQNITVIVDSTVGNYKATYTVDEINGSESLGMEATEIGSASIREIRIYRYFKTVCIEKITADNLAHYAQIQNNSILFNENTVALLKKLSHSFLTERLIASEVALDIVILLFILLNAAEERLNPNNRGNHGPIKEIKRFISDIKKYWQYMNYAAKADLKAEVANSYLNRLWWLLEPLFNMLVYVIVFGKMMGNSVENYATFVFAGLLMWNFFSKTINYSVKCVRNNRDIVTKVYVPKHVLLISNMMLNFYKLLFSLIVLVPMLFIFKVKIGIFIFWIIPAYTLMLLISFGIGMILLHYGVYIDDLGYAVGILLQMLMFLSGVFYDAVTGLSTPLNVMMLILNPISMFIDAMRNALLYNTVADVPLIIIWHIMAALISYIGIHMVYKNENSYVKVV